MKRPARWTRTSTTDPIRVDWLPAHLTAPGRLGITIAPGKRGLSFHGQGLWDRSLGQDLDELRRARVDVLVCLAEVHELAHIGIPHLPDVATLRGFDVRRFPIRDLDVPRQPTALRRLLATIHDDLGSGRSVVVHCVGGLGRSGVVVGCWLVSSGLDPLTALGALRSTRGPRCPETPAQIAYISAFSTA